MRKSSLNHRLCNLMFLFSFYSAMPWPDSLIPTCSPRLDYNTCLEGPSLIPFQVKAGCSASSVLPLDPVHSSGLVFSTVFGMTKHRDQGCFNFVSLESTWAWHKVTPQIILVSLPQNCSRPPLYTDSFICFMIIGSVIKNSPGNAGDVGEVNLIPGSGKLPGEGNGNPLQYSCLGNPMDRGAWQATVMGSQRVGHD